MAVDRYRDGTYRIADLHHPGVEQHGWHGKLRLQPASQYRARSGPRSGTPDDQRLDQSRCVLTARSLYIRRLGAIFVEPSRPGLFQLGHGHPEILELQRDETLAAPNRAV